MKKIKETKIKYLSMSDIERISPGMYHGVIYWMKDGKVYSCIGDARFNNDADMLTGTFTLNKILMEQFS